MSPSDFASYPGGKALLDSIETLLARVDRHRAEIKQQQGLVSANAGSTLSRNAADEFSDSEERNLLSSAKKKPLLSVEVPQMLKASTTLHIQLEPHTMSLNEVMGRDRKVNPEFAGTANDGGSA